MCKIYEVRWPWTLISRELNIILGKSEFSIFKCASVSNTINKLIAEYILSDKMRASFTYTIRVTYKWTVVQLSAEDACYIPSTKPTNRYYFNSRSLHGSISLTTVRQWTIFFISRVSPFVLKIVNLYRIVILNINRY